MNYANLISAMSAVIKANGNKEITGDLLQQVLRAMINSLGQGYQFMGVAATATDPGTQDARLFYFAEGPGIYSNFGPLTVPDDGQVYLLVLGASWVAVQLPIPTFAGFSDLVMEVAGKMALVPTATEGHVAEFGNAGQIRDGGVQTSALARRDAGAVAGNLAEFDSNGDPKDSGIAAGDVMKIPAGLMPFGPAGLAEALLDTDSAGAKQEFSLRKSGGDGGAYFRRLLGNTKAFNQLWGKPNTQTKQQVTISYDNAEKCYVLNGTALAGNSFFLVGAFIVSGLPVGHMGLISVEVIGGSYTPGTAENGFVYAVYVANPAATTQLLNSAGRKEAIQTAAGGSEPYPTIKFYAGDVFDNLKVRVSCIDLTLMFGAGNEPATVAEFREKYPLLYYAYGRKLIHNKVAKVITKGANQWDDTQRVDGYYIRNTDGTEVPSPGSSHTGYVPVLPDTDYYFKQGVPNNEWGAYYDKDKNYISGDTRFGQAGGAIFHTPANCYYIRVTIQRTDPSSNICINLSDAEINGQYFPYWERELALDITNQEDTDGNKPFAGGMMSAGSAADYANEVGGAKVMAKVKFSDLNWTYNASYGFSSSSLQSEIAKPASNSAVANIICAERVAASHDRVYADGPSGNNIAVTSTGIISINSAYTDAPTFLAAMGNTELVYEKATPVPFTWKEPLNTGIKVSKYGTEEITPAQTENIDNAPFRAVTTYSISVANLVAALSSLGNRGGAKGLLGGSNPGNGEELTPEEESPKEELKEDPKEELKEELKEEPKEEPNER